MNLLQTARVINARQTAQVSSVLESANRPITGAQALARLMQRAAVDNEATRILALPRWDPSKLEGLDLTERYKTPGGTMTLRPIQSLALHWIEQCNGGLLPMGVGSGKTVVSLLAGAALKARNPMLLIPPSMWDSLTIRTITELKAHFKLPGNLRIVCYSQLSTAKNTDLLERERPDVIICDEAHFVARASAARTKRFLRYFQKYPTTKFVAMSGTLTGKGLEDYGHLAELALREGSPLPREAAELLAWGNCIDSRSEAREQDWDMYARFHDVRDIPLRDDEAARDGERRKAARAFFLDRLRSTPGVVATREASVSCSLTFARRELRTPPEVLEALRELYATWCRPDGEELMTALDLWRYGMHLSAGFYYRWVWPDGVVDWEWMTARAEWHRQVRRVLQGNQTGLDSPFLVYLAVVNDRLDHEPEVCMAWHGWDKVRQRPKPPQETVWVSKYLIDDAVTWAKKHPRGLVWYSDAAIGRALQKAGLETYFAGEVPPEQDHPAGMALSVQSHGTGLNFQYDHSENLIMSWPSSGKTCEQLIGRTHRAGQEADVVEVEFYGHTEATQEAIEKSRSDARYIEETQGSPQKLNLGTWL